MKYIITTTIIFLMVTIGVIYTNNNIKAENEIKEHEVKIIKTIEPKESEMPLYNIPLDLEFQKLIYEECNNYSLSYELVLGVIKQESQFDYQAVSRDGNDMGLFQINRHTYPWIAQQLDIENFDIRNPEHNIKAGIWYLDYLRDYWADQMFLDEEVAYLMLNSYNQGIYGCTQYAQKYGFSYYYAKNVLKYKEEFETNAYMEI